MLWWAQRGPENTRARRGATWFLGCAHLMFGAAYAVPGLAITNALVGQRSQISIVNAIDHYGPWWVLGYLLSGAALLAAVVTDRLLPTAHLLGAVVSGAFAFAVWYGTFASEPNRSVVTGVLATGWVFWHWVMMLAYTDELAKYDGGS
jgi:hypothetical protein